MGWAHCGQDSAGRDIGYAIRATCDHPGCTVEIDRGVSFVCGAMHGESECSCEKYFCGDHRDFIFIGCLAGVSGAHVCLECSALWEEHLLECPPCKRLSES